jgi:hypothetical protein
VDSIPGRAFSKLRLRCLLLFKESFAFFSQTVWNQSNCLPYLPNRTQDRPELHSSFRFGSATDAKNSGWPNGQIREIPQTHFFRKVICCYEESYLGIIWDCLFQVL